MKKTVIDNNFQNKNKKIKILEKSIIVPEVPVQKFLNVDFLNLLKNEKELHKYLLLVGANELFKKKNSASMKTFLFKNKEHKLVLDIKKIIFFLKKFFNILKQILLNDFDIVFISTLKKYSDALEEVGEKYQFPYINSRWVGGFLTNFDFIFNSIKNFKVKLEEWESYKKRFKKDDATITKKQFSTLAHFISIKKKLYYGLRNLKKRPLFLFFLNYSKEKLSFKEAKIVKDINLFALVNNSQNSFNIDFFIPFNNYHFKSIDFFLHFYGSLYAHYKALFLKKE